MQLYELSKYKGEFLDDPKPANGEAEEPTESAKDGVSSQDDF